MCVKEGIKDQSLPISSTPGRLVCGYCGGKGTVGAASKVCPRCGGAQTLRCDACFGKGTVACRREVFVKVCPRCRFLGKITCPTCGGSAMVSPAVAAARRAQGPRKPAPGISSASAEGAGGAPRGEDGKTEKSSAETVPSSEELMERYKKLVPICEAHHDVFVEDLTPKADTVRTNALSLVRKLRNAGATSDEGTAGSGGTLAGLEALIGRALSFRKRWNELRDLYDDERRSYASLKSNWALRDEALQAVSPKVRDEEEKDWNKRIDLLVRILEKNVAKLREDDPSWIPIEVESMEKAWKALGAKGKDELAALEAATASKAAAAVAAKNGKAAKSGGATGGRSASGAQKSLAATDTGTGPGTSAAAAGIETGTGTGAGNGVRKAAASASQVAARSVRAQPGAAAIEEDGPAADGDDGESAIAGRSRSRSGGTAIVWVVVGVLAACLAAVALVAVVRSRRSAAEAEESRRRTKNGGREDGFGGGLDALAGKDAPGRLSGEVPGGWSRRGLGGWPGNIPGAWTGEER